ncbi:MAG: transglutaminase-like domain-containing protein [Acidimicrobiales bacterium]
MGTSELLRFYETPTEASDLGRRAALAADLPSDPRELGEVVRGLLVHNYQVKVRGLELPAERMTHMQTVGAERILDNVVGLDASPLAVERPPERRMVGFCYHFALLHCALLRDAGTPARVRCGFASYFEPTRWIDHWVVEWWDGKGWRLEDPQIGRGDLTEEDFRDGVTAWSSSRTDPSYAGAYGNGELWGWDELRGSLINDVAALNKVEVSGWYWCERLRVEPIDEPHEELDASLDVLARLAAAAASIAELNEAYELYPDVHPPSDAVAR